MVLPIEDKIVKFLLQFKSNSTYVFFSPSRFLTCAATEELLRICLCKKMPETIYRG